MAKSKNHTAHNQSYKAHRNGIKRPARNYHPSRKGVDVKFLKNQKYALKGSLKALAKAKKSGKVGGSKKSSAPAAAAP